MKNGSLMKVKSVTECSPWSILQYFCPTLSGNWFWKPFLVFLRVAILDRFYCMYNCWNWRFWYHYNTMALILRLLISLSLLHMAWARNTNNNGNVHSSWLWNGNKILCQTFRKFRWIYISLNFCNNNNQTLFFNALSFARSLQRC